MQIGSLYIFTSLFEQLNVYIWGYIAETTQKIFPAITAPSKTSSSFSDKYGEILDCKVERYEEPTFIESVPTDKYIWFIPFRTNEILYLSLETNEIREFIIADEEETVYSLKNRILDHKYLLEYVKDDRYIGLYSLKNEHILEIDANTLAYRLLPFTIDDACLEMYINHLLLDGRKMDKTIFAKMMKGSSQNKVKEKVYNVGKQINTKMSNM